MEELLALGISLILTGILLGIGLTLGKGLCRAAFKGFSHS